jgi:hypothetical protein
LPERFLQCALLFGGGLRYGETQVDDARPGVDALENRRGKFRGRRARQLSTSLNSLGKNGSNENRAVRTDRGCRGAASCGEDSCDKGPVKTGGAISPTARRTVMSWNFANTLSVKIGMLDRDRAVDQPNLQFGVAAGTLHQRCQLDQRQGIPDVWR